MAAMDLQSDIFSSPWFFYGCLDLTPGTVIEICGMRYNQLEQAWEAREILDVVSRAIYRVDVRQGLNNLYWVEQHIIGRIEVKRVENVSTQYVTTFFTIAKPLAEDI
jgi:hypothetical protein